MAEQDNIHNAKRAVAAINAHDLDAYVQHFDESYIGETETMPGPLNGQEGARQLFQTLLTAFPDIRLDVEQFIVSGENVVMRGLLTGTHQGSFAGMDATGKRVSWRSCIVTEMKNGKVVRTRTYADNVSLLRQLGVLPVPKATTA